MVPTTNAYQSCWNSRLQANRDTADVSRPEDRPGGKMNFEKFQHFQTLPTNSSQQRATRGGRDPRAQNGFGYFPEYIKATENSNQPDNGTRAIERKEAVTTRCCDGPAATEKTPRQQHFFWDPRGGSTTKLCHFYFALRIDIVAKHPESKILLYFVFWPISCGFRRRGCVKNSEIIVWIDAIDSIQIGAILANFLVGCRFRQVVGKVPVDNARAILQRSGAILQPSHLPSGRDEAVEP